MTDPGKEFLRGARSVTPILIGIMPFSVVFGFAMRNAGLSGMESSFFALSLLAGASQLASVQLYALQTPALIILATAVVINLRYSMYSLSLRSILEDRPYFERLFAAFIVSDQSYAFTMTEADRNPGNPFLPSFLFGTSITIYAVWEAGIFLGYNLGTIIPAGLSLDFAIPLVFLSLLIPHLKDRDRQISALTGAAAALILVPRFPLQSGMLVSMIIGIASGMIYNAFEHDGRGDRS